jgi:hypothetical protein
MQCPVLRSISFRRGTEDLKQVRQLLRQGHGRLLDQEGIDWWDLTSLLIAPEIETVLRLERVSAELPPGAELWTTQTSWLSSSLVLVGHRELRAFSAPRVARLAGPIVHYAKLSRRFSPAQIREIFFDKYDPGYVWRSRFAPAKQTSACPLILVPSAYNNVSRAGADYARLLPEVRFLLVATRRSARQFQPPPNLTVQDLASHATSSPTLEEIASIMDGWKALRAELSTTREFDMLARAGILDSFSHWFRDGLRVRNAWRNVMEREPVAGVLCGDDSNIYTRLPVLLAARRKIPTVDFHHGALDGRYLLKDMPCDIYLAKSEMERDYLLNKCSLPAEKVRLGAPPGTDCAALRKQSDAARDALILFSEPYEAANMRTDEVYRELLPPLCRVARDAGRSVIIKLHPFESCPDRKRLIRTLVSADQYRSINVVDGPLTAQLLSRAWCGVTVESTTVIDCLNAGVPCFLCGWLALSPFEYVEQYSKWGIGRVLRDVEEITKIPSWVTEFKQQPSAYKLWEPVQPECLRSWLGASAVVSSASGKPA